MNDLNHKHEPPQLKERSSSVNDLLGAFSTIRPRADRHHDLIEGTPQWGGECLYTKVLNMTTPHKSCSSRELISILYVALTHRLTNSTAH